ncbi:hypothetical protein E2C01_075872 [Portunus trituberculatus]|uniref:Uncharacterized protein n=1 Tax=Portunus trituberculatus TaxID=210409 RepID=A0A5B7IG70_PORTR|nr:hypothetical protein [Portunus trituberculatus]
MTTTTTTITHKDASPQTPPSLTTFIITSWRALIYLCSCCLIMQDTALRVADGVRDEKTQSINVGPDVLGQVFQVR